MRHHVPQISISSLVSISLSQHINHKNIYAMPFSQRHTTCCHAALTRSNLNFVKILFFISWKSLSSFRNRNLEISKELLKSRAHQGTSLFMSAATNQRGVSKEGSREAQV